jgi:predicted enzyme related to lactoylglutathione lyase
MSRSNTRPTARAKAGAAVPAAPVTLCHFEIDCDDVERARRFYQAVFGWRIEPWGPPNYYLIFPEYPDRRVSGDLRERDEPLTGGGNRGFVATFSVPDLAAVVAAVEANGGSVETPEQRIEGVGNLLYFADSEGNRVGVMRIDRNDP